MTGRFALPFLMLWAWAVAGQAQSPPVVYRVADILPGPSGSQPDQFRAFGSEVVFTANSSVDSIDVDLWFSDGTGAGTRRPVDLAGGPGELTVIGGTVFFVAFGDPDQGVELWKSDGTTGGTALVADIQSGSLQSSPRGLTDVNGTLFFNANDGVNGRELWKSDGTTVGTTLVKDLTPGSGSTTFSEFPGEPNFVAVGDRLFFVADDGVSGRELWVSDGTAGGTGMVVDLNPGSASSMFYSSARITGAPVLNMIAFQGELYFAADDGKTGVELWRSDGTAQGTLQVADISLGGSSSNPNDLAIVGDTLFFVAGHPSTGTEVWATDGQPGGTRLVRDINPTGSSFPSWLTAVGDRLFFQADDGEVGAELWVSDGSSEGTLLAADIEAGPGSSFPGKPVDLDGVAYFSAEDSVNGLELWRSDGIPGAAERVSDIAPGSMSTGIFNRLIAVNGLIFMSASDGTSGDELWALLADAGGPGADSASNFLYSGTDADPVSTFSGELTLDPPPDLDLGGPMPLRFDRYYGSYLRRNGVLGDLGNNWLHNFDARLHRVGITISYRDAFGRVTRFIQDQSTGEWTQLTNLDTPYQLIANPAEDARLYDRRTRRIYTFDYTTATSIAGRLKAVSDGRGNQHVLTYDTTTAQLQTVEDGLGRELQFTYNDDLIPKISVVSATGRSVSFEYTDPLDTESLTRFTDAEGKTTVYDYADTSQTADRALMTHMTRPRGNVPFIQTFYGTDDGVNSGKVATQTNADGHTVEFLYDGETTTMIDARGGSRVHTHTASGQLVAREDQAGMTFTMSSDETGRRSGITDRLGDESRYEYHEPSGEPALVVHASGAMDTFDYELRVDDGIQFHDLVSVGHSDGTSELYSYDAQGNLTSETDEAGNTTTFTYNSRGQMLTRTNASGGITRWTYSPDGTVATRTDPAGNVTTFAYDALKRVSGKTFADGSSVSMTYNRRNQLLTRTDENGATTTHTYDANGNLASISDPTGAQTAYGYDGNDRIVSITDPLGGLATRSYDELGRLATTTNRAGETTTFERDERGRLVAVVDAEGGRSTRTWDDEGILLSRTDALGRTTRYETDSMGQVTRTTSPAGAVTETGYDELGREISRTDPMDGVTRFSRDARGHLVGITQPDGTGATFDRGPLGNITSIIDPNGNEWSRTFDDQGLRIGSTDPLMNTWSRTRDARNRPALITFPGALGTRTLNYDDVGNLIDDTYSDGAALSFTYDDRNLLVSGDDLSLGYDARGLITDSNGLAIDRDAMGRITSIEFAPGKAVTYGYDRNGRVTSVTDWMAGQTRLGRDRAGQVTSLSRPNGTTTRYTYDGDGRLVRIDEEDRSTIVLRRNPRGQVIEATRDVPLPATGANLPVATAAYDAAAQVMDRTAGGPAVTAGYDAMGRLVSETGGVTRSFEWDLASRLTSWQSGTEAPATATYDSAGARVSLTRGGQTSRFVWNYGLGLASIAIERRDSADHRYYVHLPDGTLLYSVEAATGARRFHHFDESGNTIYLTDDTGAVTDSYAYSPYGSILANTGSSEIRFGWQGRFGIASDGDGIYYMRERYYDAQTRRFISRDPLDSTAVVRLNPYQYGAGNPLFFHDPMGKQEETTDQTPLPSSELLGEVAGVLGRALNNIRGGVGISSSVASASAGTVLSGISIMAQMKATVDTVAKQSKTYQWKVSIADELAKSKTGVDSQFEKEPEGYIFPVNLLDSALLGVRASKIEKIRQRNRLRNLAKMKAFYEAHRGEWQGDFPPWDEASFEEILNVLSDDDPAVQKDKHFLTEKQALKLHIPL